MLQTAVRVVESPSPLLVIVSLSSARQGRQDRVYRVSVECEIPVVKVFARYVRLWLSESHVLWARFRHRLSHCSHGFRESCHRCVHRSVRRLLTHFNHLCRELVKLTSQHLNFLSSCHRHSISQYHNTRNKSMNPNSRNACSATMQEWETTQNGCKVRCAQG